MHVSPEYPSLHIPGQLPLVLKQTSDPLQNPHWIIHPGPYHLSGQAI